MLRADHIALLAVLALAFDASAQTPPPEPLQDPLPEISPDPVVDDDPDAAYSAALVEYQKRLIAWWSAGGQTAAAYAYTVPDGAERLHLLNTSATDVMCVVHRGGEPTGRVLNIDAGSVTYVDGPPSGLTDVSLMAAYIPIAEIQLRCPLVSANALHGNFRSGRRYVIQRAPSGSLVLVEVVAQ